MKKVMILTAALLLAACQNTQMNQGQIAGGLAGAVVGGFAGSMFGGGTGQLLFILAGATVGGGAGYSIGDQLLPSDQTKFQQSTQHAMDNVGDGQLVNWINPQTGVAGTIKPTRSYYAGNNRYCRDFQASIAVNAGVGEGAGRACRIAGGAWFIDEKA